MTLSNALPWLVRGYFVRGYLEGRGGYGRFFYRCWGGGGVGRGVNIPGETHWRKQFITAQVFADRFRFFFHGPPLLGFFFSMPL